MQPNSPYPPASPSPPHPPEYGFIMDPGKPPKRNPLQSLGNGSPVIKIAFVVGAILIILIFIAIARSIFSGGGNTDALVAVAQQQQEIIHIAKNPTGQTAAGTSTTVLSTTNQNSATTTQATITSAQTQLLTYMKTNGKKINDKVLVAKVSATTDQQLQSASTNSTFNTTFKQVLQAELKDYQTALQQAYGQTSGPKGKALLNQQYKGAQLLIEQLNSPAS